MTKGIHTRQGDCLITIATFLARKYGRTVDGCRSMAGLLEKIFRTRFQELDPDQFQDILRTEFANAKTWDQFVRYVKRLQGDRTCRVNEIARDLRQTHRRPQKKVQSDADQVNLFREQRKRLIDAETKTH